MLRTLLFTCVATSSFCIIVKDPEPVPEYVYSYNIEDFGTGDSKSQHEIKLGDVVRGGYTVLDPDGTKRTVEYSADAKHGFQAVVHQEPVAIPHPYPIHALSLLKRKCQNPQRAIYVPSKPVLPPVQDSDILEYDLQESKQYFTPGNEIDSDAKKFVEGEYFRPEYRT